MAVKIRLKRMGKIRAPFYRVVVMDSRTKRDGRAIEEIGKYHPTESPSVIEISSERAQHWLSHGAQPTEAVEALLKKTGDWQKFTGQPGAEGTVQVKPVGKSKKELYEAALAASGKTLDVKGDPTSARRRPKPTAEEVAPAPEAPVAETPTLETPTPETLASPETAEPEATAVAEAAPTPEPDEAGPEAGA